MKQKSYIIDNKELMSEWDWDANADLDPNTVTYGSHVQPWWYTKRNMIYVPTQVFISW